MLCSAPVVREDARPQVWRGDVDRLLSAFPEERLGKVPGPRLAFGFCRDLDPTLLLESLKAATPGCFHFYAEPERGTAFLGASPERLFRRYGRSVESEAVAGTRPRGVSSAEDEGLRDDLLHSTKDLSEHTYVSKVNKGGARTAL